MLKVDQVSVKNRQGSRYLLEEISFGVKPGERLGVVGASGAGKTSLLRLLNRLESPTTGTLFWHGQPYREIPVTHWRQQLMLVLQESTLLEMTVAEAITYPLRLQRVSPVLIAERLSEWTERLRIPSDWLHRTELQLSVGQRQWVALARALVAGPQVLLLDEPTSALDSGKANHLMETLTAISGESLTIIMVNHQLEILENFAQRVLELKNGRLIQDTPANQMDWNGLRSSLAKTAAEHPLDWE